MKKFKPIFIIIILVLIKTFSYSNELKASKNIIPISDNEIRFNFTANNVFNLSKNNITSFSYSSDKSSKKFLKMGIAGIVLTSCGITFGIPSTLLLIGMHNYLNSPNNSDNIVESLLNGLIIRPLAAFVLVFGGIFIAISSIMLIIGVIFIPVGFANYAKHRKNQKTSMFIDSMNENLSFGLKIII